MGPRVIQNGDVGVANLLISSSFTCISPSRNPSSFHRFCVSSRSGSIYSALADFRKQPLSRSRETFQKLSTEVSSISIDIETTRHLALISLHRVDLTSRVGLGLGFAVIFLDRSFACQHALNDS